MYRIDNKNVPEGSYYIRFRFKSRLPKYYWYVKNGIGNNFFQDLTLATPLERDEAIALIRNDMQREEYETNNYHLLTEKEYILNRMGVE